MMLLGGWKVRDKAVNKKEEMMGTGDGQQGGADLMGYWGGRAEEEVDAGPSGCNEGGGRRGGGASELALLECIKPPAVLSCLGT